MEGEKEGGRDGRRETARARERQRVGLREQKDGSDDNERG